MKFCANCGQQMNEDVKFCPGCGEAASNAAAPAADVAQPVYMVKPKTPGRGFGISSMVLGIIGIVYGFIAMVAALTYTATTTYYVTWEGQLGQTTSSATDLLPVAIIPLVLATLALCFAPAAKRRGYKNGVSTSGLVLGLLSLLMSVVAIAVMCCK